MEAISTIIVDDESLAREGLSSAISVFEGFSVVAQCGNGNEALNVIRSSKPDVLFLDIEMPGINGMQLLASLNLTGAYMPLVVFVTAFKEFALDAFNCQAFDYLLKPYSDERLNQCLNRLQQAHKQKQALAQQAALDNLLSRKTGKSLAGFMDSLHGNALDDMPTLNDFLAIKSGSEWLRIKIDNILWLEAACDYVCVHTAKENYIVRKPLKSLHSSLCQKRFLRLNRSSIVNASKIEKVAPNQEGEYRVQLSSGDHIKVSRRYRLMLKALNGQL